MVEKSKEVGEGTQTYTIEIYGEDYSDILYALDEIRRLVDEGYSSGFDDSDTGSYSFESKGDWNA